MQTPAEGEPLAAWKLSSWLYLLIITILLYYTYFSAKDQNKMKHYSKCYSYAFRDKFMSSTAHQLHNVTETNQIYHRTCCTTSTNEFRPTISNKQIVSLTQIYMCIYESSYLSSTINSANEFVPHENVQIFVATAITLEHALAIFQPFESHSNEFQYILANFPHAIQTYECPTTGPVHF